MASEPEEVDVEGVAAVAYWRTAAVLRRAALQHGSRRDALVEAMFSERFVSVVTNQKCTFVTCFRNNCLTGHGSASSLVKSVQQHDEDHDCNALARTAIHPESRSNGFYLQMDSRVAIRIREISTQGKSRQCSQMLLFSFSCRQKASQLRPVCSSSRRLASGIRRESSVLRYCV
jgi:hypothetical protein